MHAEPVFTTADTSVRDAVRHMTEQRSSYVLIRCPTANLGIFTDRDLRTRVVAAGIGVDAPIGQVMSAPARTVTADRVAATVLMDMLESGMRHMPVLDPRGQVLGVLEDADLRRHVDAAELPAAALDRTGGRPRRTSGRRRGHRRSDRRPVPQRHRRLRDAAASSRS